MDKEPTNQHNSTWDSRWQTNYNYSYCSFGTWRIWVAFVVGVGVGVLIGIPL